MSNVFTILLAIIAAFIPVLFWAYAFSYIDAEPLSAKRFVSWIFVGGISVIPVAFMPEVLSFLGLSSYNVFAGIEKSLSPIVPYTSLLLFLGIVFLLMGILFLAIRGWDDKVSIKWFGRSGGAFLLISILFPLFWWCFFGKSNSSTSVSITSATLVGFVSITLAYFVVAIIEEFGKHLSIFSFASHLEIAKDAITLVIFSALGFAFFENILYFTQAFVSSGAAGVWVSRSIFSIGLHVLAAVAIAVPLAYGRRGAIMPKISSFLSACLFGVLLHAGFDIGLSFGKTWIIGAYALFGYFYVTKVFYKE